MRDPFSIFDRDGDGLISAVDIQECLKALGEKMTNEEIDEVFKDFGQARNGLVTYDEFLKILT